MRHPGTKTIPLNPTDAHHVIEKGRLTIRRRAFVEAWETYVEQYGVNPGVVIVPPTVIDRLATDTGTDVALNIGPDHGYATNAIGSLWGMDVGIGPPSGEWVCCCEDTSKIDQKGVAVIIEFDNQ